MAMKLIDDIEMAQREIAAMKKMTLVFESNISETQLVNYEATPRIHCHGLLKLNNFNEKGDKKSSV